jgi:hypothetical protein
VTLYGPDETDDEILASCDDGIREVVRFLRELGFRTTDSGDGRSKPTEEEWVHGKRHPQGCRVFDTPHVVICTEPLALVPEALRLAEVLTSIGVELTTLGPVGTPDGVRITADFNPVERVGVITLVHLDDAQLAERRRSRS